MPSGRQKIQSTQEQEETARLQRKIAEELFTSTAGMRGATTDQLTGFLQTGMLPQSIDPSVAMGGMYTQGRENLEDQYSRAREQILNQSPTRGGQLNAALNDLSSDRARAVGGLETQIQTQVEQPLRQQLFQAALGTAYGQPPIALSGLGAAGGQFGNIAMRSQAEQLHREQQAKEEWQQIGSMAGMAFT